MSDRLSGRVAIVVGGGQADGETVGNGRAACLTYARHVPRVLAVDRHLDSAEQTAKRVRDEGFPVEAHQADITSEKDTEAIPEAALAAFGRIDILHNNVGIVPAGSTEQLPVEQWRA